MEYMKIVEKSFSNAWRYKFLWLFGFFVSVTDGFGGGHWWTDKMDRFDNWHSFRDYCCFDIEPALIIMFVLAAVAIWFLFWVMAVLSEGALIHGISRKELNQEVSFKDCWSAGFGKFFRLFGIMLVAIAAVLLSLVGFLVVIVPSYFASTALGVLLTLFAVPLLLAIILLVICVEGWAIRFGMLYDNTWLTAIVKGWSLFKENIWKTLGVAFSSFLVPLIFPLRLGKLPLERPFCPFCSLISALFLCPSHDFGSFMGHFSHFFSNSGLSPAQNTLQVVRSVNLVPLPCHRSTDAPRTRIGVESVTNVFLCYHALLCTPYNCPVVFRCVSRIVFPCRL